MGVNNTEYFIDTIDHIKMVKRYIEDFENVYDDELTEIDAVRLLIASECHDQSKLFDNNERDGYIKLNHDLKDIEYGTPEYFNIIKSNDCVSLHYKNNPHHPEYHVNGIIDMTPYQLVDMVADWMAAHYRKNVSFDMFLQSMEFNKKRFNISDDLYTRLLNTHLSILKKERVVPNVFKYIK